MADVVIENPIINSPFEEPTRHFRFDDDGITDEIVVGRRESSYFVPIPAAKKKSQQILFEEWTRDRILPNEFITEVRAEVARWRKLERPGTTAITRRLLAYWESPERERRLFFCQLEALETAIFLTEAAGKLGVRWVDNRLREESALYNPGLHRVAFKMATGSGKTVVMAMLIAWQSLNKLADPKDRRFSDTFLVVTPGITIRDRLRVLLPSDPGNYYRALDLVPPDAMGGLGRAKVLVTNFHGFRVRETTRASKTTKEILGASFTETPDQMVRRVCRELGTKRNIVVLNDEAHHCYVRRSTVSADGDEEAVLKGDERKEAEQRNADARVWASGLEAVAAKLGARVVYDLSATPFFLRGSGYLEGKIFPWVVSDFSLIDAIEAGIVKVPRVPVSDDSMTGALPTYRELWTRIRDDLPRKGRKTDAVGGEPRPPAELEGALRSLYGNYERQFRIWEASEAHRPGATPPVFIVVCNNTNVSKLVFDFVAGWEKPLPGDAGTVVVPGALPLFSNERGGGWAGRPRTILVDSSQLEAEGAMSAEFKRLVATEIEEFKADYRTRFPGRDSEELTDEDLLREVMNTVGKAGKLGEAVRCVVSVSMLTEGWDANTVTHILGVRAFGTQLLCEQVVGRGLRRRSYTVNDEGRFDPEYAEVYGVPFSFIPSAGSSTEPPPPKTMTRVRALPERAETAEISFPRVAGYRYELARTIVEPNFGPEDRMTLSTADTPTRTKVSSILGEQQEHTLDDLAAKRPQEIAFHLTKRLLDAKFGDELGGEQPWMFPVLLRITRRWVDTAVDVKGDAFVGMLLLAQRATDAVERLYGAIVRNPRVGKARLNPILRAYDPIGSTASVDFDTSKDTYTTSGRSHVSHVVLDSGWEAKMAQVLEDHRAVRAYVKNQGLGFTVPYVIDGEERQYLPDFLVRLDDGHGGDDLLKVIVEVSGAQRRDKEAKVNAARNLWVPAVNAHGGFGRWDYVEVTDPWDAEGVLDSLAYHAQVVA